MGTAGVTSAFLLPVQCSILDLCGTFRGLGPPQWRRKGSPCPLPLITPLPRTEHGITKTSGWDDSEMHLALLGPAPNRELCLLGKAPSCLASPHSTHSLTGFSGSASLINHVSLDGAALEKPTSDATHCTKCFFAFLPKRFHLAHEATGDPRPGT